MANATAAKRYDVVIVGGGSAGCVFAARLAANPDRSVLLVEAGPDYGPYQKKEVWPQELLDVGPTPAASWHFDNEPSAAGRIVDLQGGKVIGGSSSVNASTWMRGAPGDYDAWAAQGNPGWSFADLLPYFNGVEADPDFGEPWHGQRGPVPIYRYPEQEVGSIPRTFAEAAQQAGYPLLQDLNDPTQPIGVGRSSKNIKDGVRWNAAFAYLDPLRGRSNLEIRPLTLVDRLTLKGARAVSVHLLGAEGATEVEADLFIVTAGAYATPTILMRSGVGPPAELARHGIKAVVPLKGVGQSLRDHVRVALELAAPADATPGSAPRQMHMKVRSAHGQGDFDLQVNPSDRYVSRAKGKAVWSVQICFLAPQSVGGMRLRAADPAAAPIVAQRYLAEPADLQGLVEGIEVLAALLGTPAGRALCPSHPLAEAAGTPHPTLEDVRRFIRQSYTTYHHPVGTCKMGPRTDDTAVVDTQGRVWGLENVYVADASIMPVLPRANTNWTAFAAAEAIAAQLTKA